MGFFKEWAVTILTTKGAKLSKPMHELGRCLSHEGLFDDLRPSDKATMISIGKQVLIMKGNYDLYFKTKHKTYHDDAVKFLVMIAAIWQGAEGEAWDWEHVRHFSQGLYGGMTEDPKNFAFHNSPIIERLSENIENTIEGAIK